MELQVSASSQDDVDRALAAFDAWPILYHRFRNGPAYKLPKAEPQIVAAVPEPEPEHAVDEAATEPGSPTVPPPTVAESELALEPAPGPGVVKAPLDPVLDPVQESNPVQEAEETGPEQAVERSDEATTPPRSPTTTEEMFRWLSPAQDTEKADANVSEPTVPEPTSPEPDAPEPATPAAAPEPHAESPVNSMAVREPMFRWLFPLQKPDAVDVPQAPPGSSVAGIAAAEAEMSKAPSPPAAAPEQMFRRLSDSDDGSASASNDEDKTGPRSFRPAAPPPMVPAPFPPSLPGLHDVFREP